MSAPPPLIALPSALVLTSTLLSTLSLSQVPRWHPALEIVDLGLKDLAPAHRWRDLDRRQRGDETCRERNQGEEDGARALLEEMGMV